MTFHAKRMLPGIMWRVDETKGRISIICTDIEEDELYYRLATVMGVVAYLRKPFNKLVFMK